MIIKMLVENTSISNDIGSEHGLSLYIETKTCKILFDTGASQLFIENAIKMNVAISEVDYLVISHSHYDHGGGLSGFLAINSKAKVIIHSLAFEKYYALRPNKQLEMIGIDEKLRNHPRMITTSDRYDLEQGIYVFSNVKPIYARPKSNKGLFMLKNEQVIEDDFLHEQNLVIEEDGKILLITGCAHNGILNILEQAKYLMGKMPDHVIGGFHLSSKSGGNETSDTLMQIGAYLLETKAKYYTCHCTGVEAYTQLEKVMSQQIEYLHAGSQLII